MKMFSLLSLLFLLCTVHFCCSKITEIPLPEEVHECYKEARSQSVESFLGVIVTFRCQNLAPPPPKSRQKKTRDPKVDDFINRLISRATHGHSGDNRHLRDKRQVVPLPCKRKEIRMLTIDEWRNITNAFKALRNDTSILPNRFAVFGKQHTGEFNRLAHSGAGFTGVHRILLCLLELALREFYPFVCLPYWDSSLDEELSRRYNYDLTSIWSDTYFGTPVGSVTSGPFAGFTGPSGYPIYRQANYDGELMTTTDYTNIISGTSYYNLVYTSLATDYNRNLENQHGTPHVYVGGTMSLLSTAAYEPVFWFHHCYIDKLFQDFREKLGNRSATYPGYPASYRHAATYPISIGNYTQADGYKLTWDNMATYEPVPTTCNSTYPDCGNRSLVCLNGRCLPTRLSISKRSVPEHDKHVHERKPRDFDGPIQNDFCIDDQCDTDQWVWLPISLYVVRPPSLYHNGSYKVKNNSIDQNKDIYDPDSYENTKQQIKSGQGNPQTYGRCEQDKHVGKIFISSSGINYGGYFKESTIIDRKLPVNHAVGFVAIKRPTKEESSQFLLGAHDDCGRVCRVMCRVMCRDPVKDENKECSGAFSVTAEKPLMYFNNIGDAIMDTYDFKNKFPRLRTDIFWSVYCDYPKIFPYGGSNP